MPVTFDLEEQQNVSTDGILRLCHVRLRIPDSLVLARLFVVNNFATQSQLTAGMEGAGVTYGSNGENGNGENAHGNDDDDDDDGDDSMNSSVSSFTGGESSFHDAKALPDVIGTLNNANVWLSTRGAVGMQLKERSPSGTYDIMQDGSKYKVIPTLTEERFALVCDANLTKRDNGGLYYDESAFYNDQAVPYFVVTVNPYIYQNIMSEVWHSTTVPCGMYFCCQGGDGAHTGEAHEDFVSIHLAYAAVGLVFLVMFVVALLPGDEEWSS